MYFFAKLFFFIGGPAFFLVCSTLLIVIYAQPVDEISLQNNSATVSIDADVENKSIFLTYKFEFPVAAVEFGYKVNGIRETSWNVLGESLELRNGVVLVEAGQVVQTMTFKIRPDERSFDRTYPSLRSVGNSGLLFFTRYLLLEEIRLSDVVLTVDSGEVIAYRNVLLKSDGTSVLSHDVIGDTGRYVYFGGNDAIREEGRAFFISNAEEENRTFDKLREIILPTTAWLDSFFGPYGEEKIFIVAAFYDDEIGARPLWRSDPQWRGEVTDSGEIFLRFFGDVWERETIELAMIVERFLFHELVHLYEGKRVSSQIKQPAWISEGLATYLTINYIALQKNKRTARILFEEILGRASRCLTILTWENIGISGSAAQGGSYPYDCGVLAYWLVDGAPESLGHVNQLKSVWATASQNYKRGQSGEVGIMDNIVFLANTEDRQDASRVLQALIQGPDSAHWRQRYFLFAKLGFKVSYTYDEGWSTRARSFAVEHLLRSHCVAPPIGYTTYDDYLELDTGDRCGPLSGNPLIDQIQGFNLFDETNEIYHSVKNACRKGEEVEFGLYESPTSFFVSCFNPMDDLAPAIVVTNAELPNG